MEGAVSEEEKEHWWQVMRTLLHYVDFFAFELDRRQKHLNKLPEEYAKRLPNISYTKLDDLHSTAFQNQALFDDMVDFHARQRYVDPPEAILKLHAEAKLNWPPEPPKAENPDDSVLDEDRESLVLPQKGVGSAVSIGQQHRNCAVLHSVYREWTAEAAAEREESFGLLVKTLMKWLPVDPSRRYEQRVVVPGCGLGRLPLEIAAQGYSCEGNEYSAYMAIASNFILNALNTTNVYDIYPWVGNISNIVNVKDTLLGCKVPDKTAVQLLSEEESQFPYPKFSMAAGSFTEIYDDEYNHNAWHGVVTCFFLDTAPVVCAYIETIAQMLRPGGVWVNLGPLLYHWVADVDANQDARYDESIELSYEELKHVILSYGLELLEESWHNCGYTRCDSSMMHTTYRTVLFAVRKPL